jgi:FixJ family two-component response regulator
VTHIPRYAFPAGHPKVSCRVAGQSCCLPSPTIVRWIKHLPNIPVISVVDDDDSMRAVICSLVRSLGLTAYDFAAAEAFLQSPRLSETSCLISDVQMPNMSGIELQSALIARGRLIPVIFFTAFPDEAVEAHAMKAGAICFLSKPFDGQDMINCIEKALKATGHGISEN